MKIIAYCRMWEEKEIEVDDKYDYLKKDWNDFTEEEKESCEEDTYELHDKILKILKKEPNFFSLESIASEETEIIIWDE